MFPSLRFGFSHMSLATLRPAAAPNARTYDKQGKMLANACTFDKQGKGL
jgi:hypothetical protein